MKKLSVICIGLSLLLQGCSSKPVQEKTSHYAVSNGIAVNNIADDFTAFWDDTQNLPLAERRALFKTQIGSKFADFYNAERYVTSDFSKEEAEIWFNEKIDDAIEEFPNIREQYTQKTDQFDAYLKDNTDSFIQNFPDLEIKHKIYIIHSLGEMDGGTRDFYGRDYLVFGVDGMVQYHDFPDYKTESPFFHHELFHVYHRDFFTGCDNVWCYVWTEGLATYVAKQLNPDATESELLLNYPIGMAQDVRRNLRPNLIDLKSRIATSEEADYRALLSLGDDGNLPARRGYYLGYLIANEMGKEHTLQDLARMPRDEVEPLFMKALDTLIAQSE